jgi:hypothetical protein
MPRTVFSSQPCCLARLTLLCSAWSWEEVDGAGVERAAEADRGAPADNFDPGAYSDPNVPHDLMSVRTAHLCATCRTTGFVLCTVAAVPRTGLMKALWELSGPSTGVGGELWARVVVRLRRTEAPIRIFSRSRSEPLRAAHGHERRAVRPDALPGARIGSYLGGRRWGEAGLATATQRCAERAWRGCRER